MYSHNARVFTCIKAIENARCLNACQCHIHFTYTCKPIMYNEFGIYTHIDSAILVSNTKEKLVKWSLLQLHLCRDVCIVLYD